MSVPRRHAVFVLAWILFWALMILVAVQDYIRNEHGSALWKPVLWEGSSAIVTTVLALVQVRGSRADDRLLGTPWRWFARQALWLPMYWIAFVPLAFGLRHGVYALVGEIYRHDPPARLFLYESMKISIFVGLFTVIRFGIKSWRALLEAKLRAEQANLLLAQARLQRLGQQMQPHFLFNALNTISSLMHTDVGKADATLVQLADVLRAALALGERHQAPLQAELALARGYAGVMAARFGERVELQWHVDEALLAREVPAMSLQPLLENVFKHTVERRRGLTRIAVGAARDGDALVLSVEDDAGRLQTPALPAPAQANAAPHEAGATAGAPDGGYRGGIGLANLRARLQALYGAEASLTLAERAGGGVRAELRLPCAS
ncbi:histidine kinase [Massilia sp. YIM B02763]|uniref:sensor histidine kinase n=1 Tax=Massilia sp. YIM B02763 TaxID=3050130 RepID=UPI0025B671A0|nr:histidine kinase [Massilia sp. YIM B02763]MDN4054483.1 histidine kinase [Massilia sp. YIM B02763]